MGLLMTGAAQADGEGPWSIEPRLGLSTEYTSNPLLESIGAHSETRGAALIDLPLRYDGDDFEFLLRPNGRWTDKSGYSALGSNFEHLDGAAQFGDERNSMALQAEVARDSSLYFVGALVDRIGVARDTVSTNADWTHLMSERAQTQLDASWSRVRYDDSAGSSEQSTLANLVDYRYWSAGPTFTYALSERNTIKLLGSYGVYDALDGATHSTSDSAQLGFVRQLTEIWSLTTSAGYSKSKNREDTVFDFFGFLFPITERSTQSGTVYAASVTRQGERFTFTGGASRALQPTGFAFLSRQDNYTLSAGYKRSERWDYGITATWLNAANPQVNSGQAKLNSEESSTRFLNVHASLNWHWTPEWVVSVTVSRITQQYGPPTVSAASSGVNVDFLRQFLRSQF